MTSSNRKMRGPALPLAPCSAVSRWPRRFPSPMPASAPSIAHCRGVEGRARTRSTGAARMTSRPSASVAKRPVSSPLRWRSQTSSWRHGRSGVSSRFTRAWAIRGSWSISVTSRRTPLGNRGRRGQTHTAHGNGWSATAWGGVGDATKQPQTCQERGGLPQLGRRARGADGHAERRLRGSPDVPGG